MYIYPLAADRSPGRRGRPLFMLRVRRLYTRLARRQGFDLVHQLNPVDVGVSLAVAGDRTPLVLGPYLPDWAQSGPGADGPIGPVALRLERAIRRAQQRRAASVLVSTPAAESVVAAGVPHESVHELPHGIDAGLWTPAPAGTGQTVLFLANLEARKGVHVLLDAFESLASRLPGARLRIAGDGPERGRAEARVRGSAARERIELLGRVGRDEAAELMRACDVYCLPSFGEPFGVAALEAMACARPVVATDAGGLRYLVPDRGGRRVPPGDPEALAAALAEVLGDPELRRTMGTVNREVVEQRFAWPRVGDRLEELYAEAIRSGGARSARSERSLKS